MAARLLVLALVLVTAPSALPAEASFPGPNGRIAFVRMTNPCRGNQELVRCKFSIWTSTVDGRGLKRVTAVSWGSAKPVWSPDGRRIAYVNAEGPRFGSLYAYVVNADGSGKRRLRALHGATFGDAISWSADGKSLVYAASEGASRTGALRFSAVSLRVDGSGSATLFRGPRYMKEVRQSPRGDRVAYIVAPPSRDEFAFNYSLFVARPDGSGARRVAAGVRGAHFDWSPDGKEILFLRELRRPDPVNPNDYVVEFDLYAVAVATGKLRRLTTGYRGGTDAVWSPDGKAVLYSNQSGHSLPEPERGTRFVLMQSDGGNVRWAGPGRPDGCMLSWRWRSNEGTSHVSTEPCTVFTPSWARG